MHRHCHWPGTGIALAFCAVTLLVSGCGGSEETSPVLVEEEEATSLLEGVADSVLPSPEEAASRGRDPP